MAAWFHVAEICLTRARRSKAGAPRWKWLSVFDAVAGRLVARSSNTKRPPKRAWIHPWVWEGVGVITSRQSQQARSGGNFGGNIEAGYGGNRIAQGLIEHHVVPGAHQKPCMQAVLRGGLCRFGAGRTGARRIVCWPSATRACLRFLARLACHV